MLIFYVILLRMRFLHWDIEGFDREIAVTMCRSGVNPLISVLLTSRFKDSFNDIRVFLDTDTLPYNDPFLMADMDKAVARINKAVLSGEKIAVYGDYDVDGMTSVAVLALWLRSKNADFEIYIPGRFDEGYGLSTSGLDTLKANGVSLVVTVDCGITAVCEAKHAKDIGLGLVITDHHECRDTLPEAEAVVNPKRHDCDYPYNSLAGVGVAFKLICALENDYLSDEIINRYGSYLALGTVADVMPVTGENRKLICAGLDMLNSNPPPGLKRLINEVSKDAEQVTASTIGFALAPRLNAAGRMGDPMLSVKLLLTDSPLEADELVTELCRLNAERRNLEQEIFEEALSELTKDKPDEPIILSSTQWYQGVTGVVAARMSERFRLPVIIISIDETGIGRGSCRSYGGFSIYDALCSCKDILENYGGHNKAAGVTVREDNITELCRRITEYYHKHVAKSPISCLRIDFEVEKPDLLDLQNVEALKKLEPFGSENPPPCLCIKEAKLIVLQSIGEGKHTRLKIEKCGVIFACIFFSRATEELGINVGDIVDVAFEPQVNEFRGKSSVQLQLLDIRASLL
ncbi:MAG: single-stranded-DNA-specific exonuclease RecJ [Oscillospiraceae bacterium]|nr:single-stranded-DNA-specific exonuclease RecJ [Oscillospiraceae bacterium]